jgi:outer membrane protein OmpA-like peptidoglycan-associated protein
MRYVPVPLPEVGQATVTLKVHVQFKDFDRRMMRRLEFRRHRWTSAQLGQFAWPPDKQREWAGKFSKVVADAWTGKHAFLLDAPGTVRYRANCEIAVRHVDDPAEANTVIVAQWVPPGAPRLRSSVTGDRHGAELDARDTEQPTPEERQNNGELPRYTAVRQIGTFAPNSDDITDVAGPIADFVSLVRRLRAPGEPLAGPKEDVNLTAEGRADATGQARHNVALAARRADNVMQKVAADTGLDSGITIARGAYNATADPTFRRVDVFASTSAATRPAQVTAAHEAGHMFGLGDEYVDEAPQDKRFARRFAGERAGHQGDVQSTMGTEAADDMIVHDSDSIMSKGSEVKPGHYVYFLQALNTMTGESWTVG